jgi:hypothetical protein
MVYPFSGMKDTQWFPMWPDIQDKFEELGLATPGHRLPSKGFPHMPIHIPGYGVGVFRCLPQQPNHPKGRARPHRLQVHCSCGQWVFFGKLGQHFKAKGHKSLY